MCLVAPSFSDDTGDAISGTVGTAIANVTVPEADGAPAPTYAASGALPGGLSFDTTTRVLSGTPTAAGSGTITVTATNSEGTADWTVAYTFAPDVTTENDDIWRLGDRDTAPATPTGGTSTEDDTPTGWTRTEPSPTDTQAVWRCRRVETFTGGVFTSATAWPAPTRIARDLFDLGEFSHAGRHRHARARADRDRAADR